MRITFTIASLLIGLFDFAYCIDFVKETKKLLLRKRKEYYSSFNKVSTLEGVERKLKTFSPYEKFTDISDTNSGFGYSVAVSSGGDTLAAGNPSYMGNDGFVQVYKRIGSAWTSIGNTLSGSGEDYCGNDITLSEDGERLAFGCYGNGGVVKTYTLDNDIWNFGGSVDSFSTVALSDDGTKMVVGKLSSNSVRFYNWDSDGLSQLGDEITGEAGDMLGRKCSISGDGSIVACGAREWEDKRGYVNVYSFGSSTPLSTLFGDSGQRQQFGNAVSLNNNGTVLAISAPMTDTMTGYVEVFESASGGTSWESKGSRISGTSTGEYFGYTTSISADGESFTTSAFYSHYVKSYDFDDDGDWEEVKHIDGTTAVSPQAQWSADISADSTIMAFGEAYAENPVINLYERIRITGEVPTASPTLEGLDCEFDCDDDSTNSTSTNSTLRSSLFKVFKLTDFYDPED